MSEPVVERIMQELRTRCGLYAVAHRSTRIAKWHPRHETLHVHQGSIVRNPIIDCPGNPPAVGWTIEAIVAAIAKPSDHDLTPIDTYKNRFGAEVIKAVTDADMWHTWSGLAVDTIIDQVEDYTGDDGSGSGVMVRMSINYKTDEDDPYSVRC